MKNIYWGLLILVGGCAQLTIKDMVVCADAGASGAHCDEYLVDHPVDLDKQEWDALRFGWLCVSPDAYGNIKVELEQACSIADCSYEQLQKMKSFFRKIP